MKEGFRCFVGHSLTSEEFDFEQTVLELAKALDLAPLLREKERELRAIFSNFGLQPKTRFYRFRRKEFLGRPGRQVMACLALLDIPGKHDIYEAYVLYKDEAELKRFTDESAKLKAVDRLIAGSYVETQKIAKYEKDLQDLSPHGKMLREDEVLGICQRLVEDTTRAVLGKVVGLFGDQYLNVDIIRSSLLKTREEKTNFQKLSNDPQVMEKRYGFVCKSCEAPSFELSFPSEKSALDTLANSSYKCMTEDCGSTEAVIREIFTVRNKVRKVSENALWLEYMIGDIVRKKARRTWLGVMHENDELDVVAIAFDKSILIECKDTSFGQNDYYSLMAKAAANRADIVLVVTTTPIHANVRAAIEKSKERRRPQVRTIEASESKAVVGELDRFLNELEENFVRSFVERDSGRYFEGAYEFGEARFIPPPGWEDE